MKIINRFTQKSTMFILALGVITMLSSCSQKMASLSSSTKMQHAQALNNAAATKTQTSAQLPDSKTTNQTETAKIQDMGSGNQVATVQTVKKYHKSLGKQLAKVVSEVKDKSGLIINRQVATINNFSKNKSLASDQSVSRDHPRGYLGLAIVFVVIGLVLELLGGVAGLGIFSLIGWICVLVGAIFFVLWLISMV